MKSIWLRLAAVFCVVALFGAACGSGSGDTATEDDASTTADTESDADEAADADEEEMTEEETTDEDTTDEEEMTDEDATDEEMAEEGDADEEAMTEEDDAAASDAGAGPSAATDTNTEAGTGTLIWAHEQEPPDLHLDDPANNLTATAWLRTSLLEGMYGIDSSTSFYPELLSGEAELTQNDDDTVTIVYTLRDNLMWSDGEPLTAEDVVYTLDINLEGCDFSAEENGCVYLRGSFQGWDLITDYEATSDTEVTMTMSSFFAGWKGILTEIYAKHAFGADAAEVNDNLREWQNADGPLPSSGPMVFDSWDRGVKLNLVRNDNYHGSNSPEAKNAGLPYVEGVQVNYVTDTDAQINALKAGEAHIVMTQPQLAFGERLSEDENFTVASTAGPVYEHWGFNVLNPHLSDPLVREAIAYGLDKTEVMAGLYTPLFGDVLPAEGLGNTYWMSNQPDYEDHQTEYSGAQADKAKEKLEEAGYTLDGEYYTHPDRGPLELRVGTTGGNELRELQQQIIQAQLKKAGINITIDNVAGGAYFGERPFADAALEAAASQGESGDPTIWDITQFAWVGGPWPGGNSTGFLSGSGNNPYGFANADFDAKADECDGTVDDTERATCYNDLDKFITTLENGDDGLVAIPLTQKPSYYGYLSSVLSQAGVAPDANNAGPLTNIQDFKFN